MSIDQQPSAWKRPTKTDLKTEGSLKTLREHSVDGRSQTLEEPTAGTQAKKPQHASQHTVVAGLVSAHEISSNLLFEREEFDKIKFIHEPLTAFIEEKPLEYPANKFLTPEQYKRAVARASGDNIPPARKRVRLVISAMVEYMRALHHCRYNSFKNVGVLVIKVPSWEMLQRKKSFVRPLGKIFMQACKMNNLQAVQKCLDADSLLVHDCDDIRMTAIHWACMRGYERLVDILIAHHSDLRAPDLLDRTPEMLALDSGSTNICQAVAKAVTSSVPVKMMIRMAKEQQARQEEEQKQKVVESLGAIAMMSNFGNFAVDSN